MKTVTLRITNEIEAAARNMLALGQDWVADNVGLPQGYLVTRIDDEAWLVWHGKSCNPADDKKVVKVA